MVSQTFERWFLFCQTLLFLLAEFIVEAEEKLHTGEGKAIWKKWERVSGSHTQTQLTLRPFCTYRFRIVAVNEIGESRPSEPTEDHVTPPAGNTPEHTSYLQEDVCILAVDGPDGQSWVLFILCLYVEDRGVCVSHKKSHLSCLFPFFPLFSTVPDKNPTDVRSDSRDSGTLSITWTVSSLHIVWNTNTGNTTPN